MASAQEFHSGDSVRHNLTLLFIDLCGSSRLAELLEAEQFATILSALRAASRESVQRFGGIVIRMQGDGVLAAFGYPTPTGKDCLQAAQAALEIHGAFDRSFPGELPLGLRPLQLHSGLHSGLTLISQGDVELGRYELVGDAANTAARLAQLAPPGAVLADLESLGPDLRHFEHDSEAEILMPGRTKCIRVARLVKYKGPDTTLFSSKHREVTPFFGREEFLSEMARILATAHSHRIVIQGPPGIGKSRLLDEIARLPQATAWVCIRGSCADESRSQVLKPFIEMIRSLQEPIFAEPAKMADELLGAICSATRDRAALILIDDWQWVDDASRLLLERLLVSVPVHVVVLARRPSEDRPKAGSLDTNFEMTPLGESEGASLVRYWLPKADPFTIGEIYRHAGGVPLFIEELAHSAKSQQPFHPAKDRYSSSSWLRALVASRLARLPLEQQDIVRTAAVLGDSFPTWLLLTVGGWKTTDLDLNAMASADFLFSADGHSTMRFKHGLTRVAVYETVAPQERRAIHRRSTRALATAERGMPAMELLEALAYHSRAAGLWDEAAEFAEQAAEQATAAFSMDIARRHYAAMLDALDSGRVENKSSDDTVRLKRWCSVVHKLGMTCIFDPLALPDALSVFELCVIRAQSTQDSNLTARSLYWLGYICYAQGQPRRAARHCREALKIAVTLDDVRLIAQLEATLGQILAASCEYSEARQLMDRALTTKQQGARRSASLAIGSAFTLACKASIAADCGDFNTSHALLADARKLVGDSVHPVSNSIRNWAMIILLWQGRWQDAMEVANQSILLAYNTNALLPLAISQASDGYARWVGLKSDVGLGQIVQAVQWMEQRNGRFFTSIYYGWLVEGCVGQGQTAAARAHATSLICRARKGDLLGLAVGYRALALAELKAGNLKRTEQYLERASHCAIQRTSRREAALNDLCRARVLYQTGRPIEAASHARRARAEFKSMQMLWHAEDANTLS
jgi:class 3 adenylate cyclase/tetratricopeptide (TPR) repeat protein